jgi:hypothetical protein
MLYMADDNDLGGIMNEALGRVERVAGLVERPGCQDYGLCGIGPGAQYGHADGHAQD